MIMTFLPKSDVVDNKKSKFLTKISTPYVQYKNGFNQAHSLFEALLKKAKSMGADAVVNIHFKSNPNSFNASANTFALKASGEPIKIIK